MLLAVISTGLGIAAALTGFFLYKDGLGKAEAMAARVPGLHLVLLNKYFVDEAIEGYLLRPKPARRRRRIHARPASAWRDQSGLANVARME